METCRTVAPFGFSPRLALATLSRTVLGALGLVLVDCAPELPGGTDNVSTTGQVALGASAAGLTLAWTDNADNEDGFHVERRAESASEWASIASLQADTTTYLDGEVNGGETFCYRVRAFNGAGNSDWTSEACATARVREEPTPDGGAEPDGTIEGAEAGRPPEEAGDVEAGTPPKDAGDAQDARAEPARDAGGGERPATRQPPPSDGCALSAGAPKAESGALSVVFALLLCAFRRRSTRPRSSPPSS